MNSHAIDYKIYGDDMQFVEVELDPSETVIAEAGAMMMMSEHIGMETIFGDGSNQGGGGFMDKLFGAGKRVLTGESLFMTAFTNRGYEKQKVAFAAPYPGKIIPMDLDMLGGKIICQKDAFLCAAKGVAIGIDFRKKLSVGFFGGEGFILEKLEGDGLAFIHAGGTICRKELKPVERLKVDTGCLVAMTRDVHYDIEYVGGIKNAFFGGEGLFYATLTGDRVQFGYSHCLSAGWQRRYLQLIRQLAEGKMKEAYSVLLADFLMETKKESCTATFFLLH